MNQDTLINWLYNHFDAEEFLRAKQRGGAFAYLANVSQQIIDQTGNANPQRVARPDPAPRRVDDNVARRREAAPAQDLNAVEETAAPAPAPAPRRQTARNAAANNGDRVRVANL